MNLKPFVILPDSNLDLNPGGNGDHFIVLFDGAGNELSRWGFYTSFVTYDPQPRLPEALSDIHFSYRVEWGAGTRRVEIQDAQGNTLASREVTESAPQVKILAPNGGEVWNEGEAYAIRWEASDADGDALSFSLALSKDDGESWIPLDLDLEGMQYELKTHGLPIGDGYMIKITATDGVNTAQDVSDAAFSIRTKVTPAYWPLLPIGLIVLGFLGFGLILARVFLARKRGGTST